MASWFGKKRVDRSLETAIEEDPQLDHSPARLTPSGIPLLTVSRVERSFQVGSQKLDVLKGIEMELLPMQLVMLKGRSGSGKRRCLT